MENAVLAKSYKIHEMVPGSGGFGYDDFILTRIAKVLVSHQI